MIEIKYFGAGRQGVQPAALCGGALATRSTAPRPAAPATASVSPASLVKVPQPDDASPAPAAAAFYVAWAGTDAVHDRPDAFAARCAPLATSEMRASRTVSLVQVRAVTRPDGTSAATGSVAYLSAYATRVTVNTAGRTTGSDITLQLARSGARWLVSAVLFV